MSICRKQSTNAGATLTHRLRHEFQAHPELEWLWGYPFALGMMVVSQSAWIYFKRKGWL